MNNVNDPTQHGIAPEGKATPIHEVTCEDCGQTTADCYTSKGYLCADCATKNKYFDALNVICDPAEQGYTVKLDVDTDDDLNLTGFSASWVGNHGEVVNAYIPLKAVVELNK
jgi:hypothetical protein